MRVEERRVTLHVCVFVRVGGDRREQGGVGEVAGDAGGRGEQSG